MIAEAIGRWRDDLARRIDPERALAAVVDDTEFLTTAEHRAPHLVDEVLLRVEEIYAGPIDPNGR